jgi:hypothetical protein
VPGSHRGAPGARAHAALAAEQGEGEGAGALAHAYCAGAQSVVALLRRGDAVLYDSRVHHSGGPHSDRNATMNAAAATPAAAAAAAAAEGQGQGQGAGLGESPQPERAMLLLSFRHARAAGDSGVELLDRSMRPEVAAMDLALGQLTGAGCGEGGGTGAGAAV